MSRPPPLHDEANGADAAASSPPLRPDDREEQAFRHDFLAREFRASYGWLKQRLRRHVDSPAEVEDLASSAFVELAVVRDLRSVREPRALLSVIARRLVYEGWRRRDLEQAYLAALAAAGEPTTPSAETLLETVQLLGRIDRLLEGLSAKARMAFLYSQIDGMTYAEIAAELGVSASMVRKYIAQALEQCYLCAE